MVRGLLGEDGSYLTRGLGSGWEQPTLSATENSNDSRGPRHHTASY